MNLRESDQDDGFIFTYPFSGLAGSGSFIDNCFFYFYLSGIAEPPGSGLLQAYIPTAETRNITLPDGTQVLINSQSTLLYPQQFTGDTRCVYLVGEANFKVKRDEEHPFIVKSSDFQVTALGTEFNVTAYPDEDEVTATLISGKVLVEYNGQKNQKF